MEIVGRDCYGVIPLRGVIRNVRPAKVNAKVLKDFAATVMRAMSDEDLSRALDLGEPLAERRAAGGRR